MKKITSISVSNLHPSRYWMLLISLALQNTVKQRARRPDFTETIIGKRTICPTIGPLRFPRTFRELPLPVPGSTAITTDL